MPGVTGGVRRPARVPAIRRAGSWLVWWVVLMSFWVILDDSIALDELLAGAGAAALGATLAELANHQAGARFRMRIEWVAPVLRLPGQVARDTVIVFAALWRLARGEQPSSGFVSCRSGTARTQQRRPPDGCCWSAAGRSRRTRSCSGWTANGTS